MKQNNTSSTRSNTQSAASKAIGKHFGLPAGHIRVGDRLYVKHDLLDDSPFQNRSHYDRDEINELRDDFDKNGQLQPGWARIHPDDPNRYQLAFSHKRKRAVKAGGNAGSQEENPDRFEGYLWIVVKDLDDEQMVHALLSENDTRSDVSVLDKAAGYVTLRLVVTRALVARGDSFEAERGDTETLEIDGKQYPLAPWRLVAERSKVSYQELSRVTNILKLPAAMLDAFKPDWREPEKFVFNSRHGRLLYSLRDHQKTQERIFRQIKAERLSASEAEKRAKAYRLAEPTPLDLKMKDAVKKAVAQQAEQSREATREENKNALSQGRSHLSAVPPASTNIESSTRSEDSEAKDTAINADSFTQSGQALMEAMQAITQNRKITKSALRTLRDKTRDFDLALQELEKLFA